MATIFAEIATRLEMTEADVKRMRLRFRELPVDHPKRGDLLRQLEISAAVAGELESLLDLAGPDAAKSPYAAVES
jgi:hypothetical protein